MVLRWRFDDSTHHLKCAVWAPGGFPALMVTLQGSAWAVVFKEMIVESKLILWSMLSFITILMVGYVYALKKGALDWKK